MKFVLVTLLMAFQLTGCGSMSKMLNVREEFKDKNKALIIFYIKNDDKTYVSRVNLITVGGDRFELIYHIPQSNEKPGSCLLMVGVADKGSYEINNIQNDNIFYNFVHNSSSNIKLNITNNDIYYLGQYNLGLIPKDGFFDSNKFYFAKANSGCPNEKDAYQEFLTHENFSSDLFKDSHWPIRVKKRLATIK